MNELEEISEWLSHFIGEKPEKFELPNVKETSLWNRLMIEEIGETIAAIKNNDKYEFIDGFIDIFFILSNLYHFSGMTPEIFKRNFEAVLNSNYTKLCKSYDEAQESLRKYHNKGNRSFTYSIKPVGQFWIVVRNDGKLMKSVLFKNPKIFL